MGTASHCLVDTTVTLLPRMQGFPRHRYLGYTPLHNAAWAGSADLVELLVARGHPVDIRDSPHDATPLGYALDSLVEGRHPGQGAGGSGEPPERREISDRRPGCGRRIAQLYVQRGAP